MSGHVLCVPVLRTSSLVVRDTKNMGGPGHQRFVLLMPVGELREAEPSAGHDMLLSSRGDDRV